MIWFALGAACTALAALAALLARLLIAPSDEQHVYLAVSERPFVEGEINRIEEIASTSGQLLRECGAQEFLIKASNGVDGVPFSLIPITRSNEISVHCIFERAHDEGYPLHVHILTEQQARLL